MFLIVLFFYFLGLGANLASLSPYVLSNFQGKGEFIFLAIQISMPLGSFFGGWISDYTKQIRYLLLAGIFLLIPTQYTMFSFVHDWRVTLAIAGLQRFLLSCNYQWMVIAVIETKGEASFSKYRAYGTIGFLLAQILLYFFSSPLFKIFTDPSQTGKIGSLAYLVCLPFTLYFPLRRRSEEKFQFKEAIGLLRNKKFFLFFFLAFFFYVGYQATDNYVGNFFSEQYGLDSVFLNWCFSVILEIPFLFLVPRLIHKFKNDYFLFLIAIFSGFIRFLFLGLSFNGFSKWTLVFLQMPHSILFAGFYMGSVYWFRKNAPHYLFGSMYGLYSIVSISLGGIVGNLVSGKILHNHILSRIVFFIFSKEISNLTEFHYLFFGISFLFFILFFVFYKFKNHL